ncbi:MAG: hypothetical protein HY890_08005 [Deltaproteobacteria bacterium]|nr:hypothetical protein [Deltaproteobacteria bacterium]
MVEEGKAGEKPEKKVEKPHRCSVCGKPSDTVICHACEDMIRAEAIDKKHEVEKAGKVDKGRK